MEVTGLAMVLELAAQAGQMLLVLAVAPLVLGVTRKIKARLLRRIGPPTWQPYVDLWKLLHKEAVLAHNASWLYRVAPYLLFASTWVAAPVGVPGLHALSRDGTPTTAAPAANIPRNERRSTATSPTRPSWRGGVIFVLHFLVRRDRASKRFDRGKCTA